MTGSHVSIGGVNYTIRTDLEPEKVAAVARFVELQLQMTAQGVATGDSYRIAILTLLKLAGEYLEMKRRPGGGTASDAVLIEDLLSRIDAVLETDGLDKGSPQGDFR